MKEGGWGGKGEATHRVEEARLVTSSLVSFLSNSQSPWSKCDATQDIDTDKQWGERDKGGKEGGWGGKGEATHRVDETKLVSLRSSVELAVQDQTARSKCDATQEDTDTDQHTLG